VVNLRFLSFFETLEEPTFVPVNARLRFFSPQNFSFMKLASIFSTLFFLLFIVSNSCQKDISGDDDAAGSVRPQSATSRDASPGEGVTVLGSQLNNPYALEVVKQAYSSLYGQAINSLLPTHYYVRFLPQTPQELGLLDTEDREYWDFPLNYQILHMGAYYHDPNLQDTTYTWLYTVVPSDFQFPQVQYEILSPLVYVPYETQLMKKAYQITANAWDEPLVYSHPNLWRWEIDI
jgi:hypothetical protein